VLQITVMEHHSLPPLWLAEDLLDLSLFLCSSALMVLAPAFTAIRHRAFELLRTPFT
jgi:hypothetical protein